MQYLTVWDVVLTPVYLIILIFLAKRRRDRLYSAKNPLRKYYMPGLYVKFGGAIFIALIYQFYYNGGDTYSFFYHSQIINSALDKSVETWFKLLIGVSPDSDPSLYMYTSQLYWYNDIPSYTVAKIGAVLGLLNGTTYMPIALLFAYFSYTGVWALYKTFVNIYPQMHKQLAIPFLFIPSSFVWGSAVFKDTVCLFGLGWMVYCTFRIFINRDFSIRNFLLLAVSFYLVAIIKVYILLSFVPALSLWLLMTYSNRIRIKALRWVANLFFLGLLAGAFVFFSGLFAVELNKYSLEKLTATAESTRGWLTFASGEEGSAYSLGEIDGTLGGMLAKLPAGVIVTLYRPFPWEAKKFIVILSAIEAIVFLFGTLFVIFKTGVGRFLQRIVKDPNLSFFLVFSIIFAFAVGISSYNFGSLSRYKIPCLPFYGALIIILWEKQKSSTPQLKSPRKLVKFA